MLHPREFWEFSDPSLPSQVPQPFTQHQNAPCWCRLECSLLPSPKEHGPGFSNCPPEGCTVRATSFSPKAAQMLSGLILPLSSHAPFHFLPNKSLNVFLLRLSVALPSHWQLSEWHFLHKQEEHVWSQLKCAGVDRGCESVEASD